MKKNNQEEYEILFEKANKQMRDLVNQLDEPEVKQLDKEIRELESYNDELIRDNNQLRNELDIQEVLSQEWIDEKKVLLGAESDGWDFGMPMYGIEENDLQNLLVPKQEDMFNGEKPDEGEVYFAVGLGGAVEINSASSIDEAVERLTEHDTNYSVSKKPVIPKFVAEAIEEDKECGYDVYESIDLIIGTNGGGLPSISDWVARNIDEYARAYLCGYTVEKEQKFYVRENNYLLCKWKNEVMDYVEAISREITDLVELKLTEQEIKDYDERYFAFAVKVEELEE